MEQSIPYNKDITYFGKTNFRNHAQVFGIKRKDRRQHMYVLGKSGTGKSVLLSNLIVQNIQNGEGLCVVDPHGELVEEVLHLIPPHRVKDVIYFNPADTDYHVGFNVLQLDDPKYKHLVASGLMGIFTKIWANAWSSRMEYILNNAILALLDTPGTTLLGIPRMLVDKDYRQMIIGNLKDPVVKAFWIHEYEQWRDQFRNEAIAPIQNKVGQFLSTSIIRNVVGQPKSTIDIFEIMNTGKIFLVNVSKGRIGEDNSALLGGMLITKIQLAAMERVRIPENERRDFYLYVDEFQNFATDSFANILSEARKYRLNLIIAHQYTAQLENKDGSKVRDAVFGNVGTMIIFRVGADDADFLEKEFEPEFMAQDLVNLPNFHVYLKLMIDGVTSRPFSASTLPPIHVDADANVKDQIIASSRALYTKKREDVENEILRWSGMLQSDGQNGAGAQEGKFPAECSECKKSIMVPFEPIAGKPIYCKDCLAKIKAGELKPAHGFITPKAVRQEAAASAPLAALGIEFTGTSGKVNSSFARNVVNNHDAKPNAGVNNNFKKPNTFNKAPNAVNTPNAKPFIKPKPTPSPLLKDLLQKVTSEKDILDKKDAPVSEVKKVIPPPISLSELKKSEPAKSDTNKAPVVNNININNKPTPTIAKAPVIPAKEATPEKMNSLKDMLANISAKEKVEEKVVEIKKEEVKVEVKPEVKPEVKVPIPTPIMSPQVPKPILPAQAIQIPPSIPKPPEAIKKVEAVVKIDEVKEVKPEVKTEENKAKVEDTTPDTQNTDTTNQNQNWQKRVANKEVPEEVLRKVLE